MTNRMTDLVITTIDSLLFSEETINDYLYLEYNFINLFSLTLYNQFNNTENIKIKKKETEMTIYLS